MASSSDCAGDSSGAKEQAELLRKLEAGAAEAREVVAALDKAPLDEARLRLAVHEAGHAAVAKSLRLTVSEVVIDRADAGGSYNESWVRLGEPDGMENPDMAHLQVAVGGYAHVGTHLGPEAESANKAADPDLPDSDLNRAYTRLRAIGGTEAEMTEAFRKADSDVRTLLRDTCVGLVADEIADYLYRNGSMSGAALDEAVTRLCPPDDPA